MQQRSTDDVNMPWLDTFLSEDAMKHLWECIDNSIQPPDEDGRKYREEKEDEDFNISNALVGNITNRKSNRKSLQDKNNLFYDNVLRGCTETLYFKEWNNYYNVHISKVIPPPEFELMRLWSNHQKQREFFPPHIHDGLYSFIVFMKIPTNWKEQHELPISTNSNLPAASDLQFMIGGERGEVGTKSFPLSSEDEGRMLIFPSWLIHQVLPFYGTEEERITISGNIIYREEMTTTEEISAINRKQIEMSIEDAETHLGSLREKMRMYDEKESRKTKK